jgi:hypothetical protein
MCFGVLHRYRQYLQELIRLPGRTDHPLLWHQADDRNKLLLDLAGFEDRLYYSNITGNTAATIVTPGQLSHTHRAWWALRAVRVEENG